MVGRLRQRAVGAAAHCDVVVDIHRPARKAAGQKPRHEERDVAKALQRAEPLAVVRCVRRLGEQQRKRLELSAPVVGIEENIASRLTM